MKKEVDKEKLKLSIHFKGERAGRQRKKQNPNSSIPKKEKKIGSQKRKKEMFKKLLQRRKTWRSKIN
jgi:hypothetical protein